MCGEQALSVLLFSRDAAGPDFACDVVLNTGQDDDVKCTVIVRAGCSEPLDPFSTVRYQIASVILKL